MSTLVQLSREKKDRNDLQPKRSKTWKLHLHSSDCVEIKIHGRWVCGRVMHVYPNSLKIAYSVKGFYLCDVWKESLEWIISENQKYSVEEISFKDFVAEWPEIISWFLYLVKLISTEDGKRFRVLSLLFHMEGKGKRKKFGAIAGSVVSDRQKLRSEEFQDLFDPKSKLALGTVGNCKENVENAGKSPTSTNSEMTKMVHGNVANSEAKDEEWIDSLEITNPSAKAKIVAVQTSNEWNVIVPIRESIAPGALFFITGQLVAEGSCYCLVV